MQKSVTLNRPYKDRLFNIIFRDKEDLLALYNTLAETNYHDSDQLEINTLDDVIYMHLKNDLSFILDGWQNLYEQQSTFNPNQPLRGFFYFADLYKSKYFSKKIYSSSLVSIPTPQYIVFYNGTQKMPDNFTLRLSDAFQHKVDAPDIEVVAHMLNINYGHNQKLMNRCQKLKEYSQFIDIVRRWLHVKGISREDAVTAAIDECIEQNILKEILEKERMIIMPSILSEFDEVAYKEMIHEEGYEEGYDIGYDAGTESGMNRLAALIDKMQENGELDGISKLSDAAYRNEMFEKYNI